MFDVIGDLVARPPERLEPAVHGVHVAAVVQRPPLALLGDVLSVDECHVLIAAAADAMARSEVIGADNSGTVADVSRTSSGTYFRPGQSSTADAVQARLMSICGLPITHGEPLQVLRYGPGEVYRPHFDFFEPDEAGPGSTLALHGQRVATVICYLSDVADGGSTVFPEIGLDVRPRRGNAVYFTYVDADGQVDRSSLHGGAPVVSGEKWILTQWCRSRPYRRTVGPSVAP